MRSHDHPPLSPSGRQDRGRRQQRGPGDNGDEPRVRIHEQEGIFRAASEVPLLGIGRCIWRSAVARTSEAASMPERRRLCRHLRHLGMREPPDWLAMRRGGVYVRRARSELIRPETTAVSTRYESQPRLRRGLRMCLATGAGSSGVRQVDETVTMHASRASWKVSRSSLKRAVVYLEPPEADHKRQVAPGQPHVRAGLGVHGPVRDCRGQEAQPPLTCANELSAPHPQATWTGAPVRRGHSVIPSEEEQSRRSLIKGCPCRHNRSGT